ncbi:VOC family protein [Xylanimonas sp. McL0601]|uniref:VOC family protein n=1 Tax=Xylanimonas sp. McL0601 TaxID=3414739 RepID=UPI003CFAC757
MPARGEVPDGAPIWFDLATTDLDRSVAYYTELFGWEHQSFGPEFGNYGSFLKDGQTIAGVGPVMENQPPAWGVYLRTSDADATAEKVKAAGGTVVFGPDNIPGQGRFFSAVDPAGAAVSFWQPDGHDGFALWGEHGAPVWFETWSSDYDKAVAFYKEAAGWPVSTMSDTPEFRYTTYGEGRDSVAGIYDATKELAANGGTSGWAVYLGADDVDALVAKARDLGGQAPGEPRDTPYGRMIGVADPNGTWFQLSSI